MACDRFYTHSIVTYAAFDELFDLFQACTHYAYIRHNKDTTDCHFHIIAYFTIPKTVSAVRKLVKSSQNTFSQKVKQVDGILTYLTHEDVSEEKFVYSKDDIVYDDKSYWDERLADGDVEKHPNDMFVDDLLADDLDLEFMARKYGRDFMKNYKNYLDFRSQVYISRRWKDGEKK